MASKINLYTREWCDMVFENKNKDFGAYVLRKDADSRHRKSLIIVVIFFSLATALPTFINKAINGIKEKNVEVTNLSKINIEQVKPQELPKEEQPQVKQQIKFVPPVIKPDEDVKEGEEMQAQDVLNNQELDANLGEDVVAETIEVKEIAKEEEQVFQAVEQMPTFPGGTEEMMKYLSKNTVYPASASENGIQGTVYVQFVVDRNGKIADVKILRGVDPELDKEAIRVAKSMPAWIAGKQNGVPVRVAFTMPVKFVLQ